MKHNVDLTLNREFSFRYPFPRPYRGTSCRSMFLRFAKYTFYGTNPREYLNHDNPLEMKSFREFTKGTAIIPTGSKYIRSHKRDSRGIERDEICLECGKFISIPWEGCPCWAQYRVKETCRKQLKYPTIIR